MESLTGPDFKTDGFKEMFEYRDRFLYYVQGAFRWAVGAVKKVILHRDAAVVNMDVDDNHLPNEPYSNQKELFLALNQPLNVKRLLYKFPTQSVTFFLNFHITECFF